MSVSAAPIAASSAFEDIARAVTAYVAEARNVAADGLTWVEFGELLLGLMRVAIQTADTLKAPGLVKRELVIEAMAALFDSVADRCVPAYLWPVWVLARPAVRQLLLAVAAGAIEQLLPLVRSAR